MLSQEVSNSYNSFTGNSTLQTSSENDSIPNNNIRMDVISSDSLTFNKYMSGVFQEEINSLKYSRNGEFSKKREMRIIGLDFDKEKNNIPNKKWSKDDKIKKFLILSKKDVAFVKENIKMCSPNDEDLANFLNYIPTVCVVEENIRIFLYNDFLLLISKIFNSSTNINVIESSALAITSLCQVKMVKFYMIKPAIPKICKFLNSTSSELEPLVKLLLYLLSFCTDNFTKKTVKCIMREGVISALFHYLSHPDEKCSFYSFRIIGNICTSNNDVTQKVIEEGLISQIKKFIVHPDKIMRKEAVWITSNIAVGSQYQIENLIEESIFLNLKSVLETDTSQIRKEAVWAICCLSNIKNPYHAEILIEQGIIEILFKILNYSNTKFILLALEAIKNFLEIESVFYKDPEQTMCDAGSSILREILLPLGFLDKLDNLQFHSSEAVYEKVVYILDNYLCEYEENEMMY